MAHEEAFIAAYRKLNDAQKRAVDTIEGPVMVIAGPGTGKTTVLTLRIATILRTTDTPPSAILAITYTDAGVKAMRAKLAALIGNRAHEVRIHTFHGFAAAMIAEYPEHFTDLYGLRQITDIEAEALIREVLTRPEHATLRPLGKPDAHVGAIMRAMSDAKRDAVSPEAVQEYAVREAARIKDDESSLSTRGKTKGQLKADALRQIAKCERTEVFADVYAAYEALKRERNFMDFDDLIIELVAALQRDELFRRLLQERFLYIHVDEHQDTNDAQNLIVRLIAEFFDVPNVFIVGDEKQAIYRFQGASVENFLALKSAWPSMEVVSLDTNYRSHQSLLDASYRMIEQNYDGDEYRELRIPLTAGGAETPQPLALVSAENVAAGDAYLVDELRRLRDQEPTATIAIITRRNRELERVLALCEASGIAVSSERSIDIFAHPVGRTCFDLLEFLVDPTKIEALARTMVVGCWGLSLHDAAELLRALRSGTAIESDATLSALTEIRRLLTTESALQALVSVAQLSGLAERAAASPTGVQVWRGIMTLAETIVRDRGLIDPLALFTALIAYRQSAESKTVKVSVGAPNSVITAMTAHGSKGLEFDYVFLPYATEDAWIGTTRGELFVLPSHRASAHDIRDLRRLFYVALTRARRHAVIITPQEEADGRALVPLRFLAEIDPAHTTAVSLPRREVPVEATPAVAREDIHARAVTDLAIRKLTTSGLSVTALNHFLADPAIFLTESVLRMPKAPAPAAEKGSALHAAMDRIWKETITDPDRIEVVIEETVSAYLATSLVPIHEKEVVLAELRTYAPAIAHSLQDHFGTHGTIASEQWVETEFQGAYDGTPITIPVHGKLDVVIDHGSVVEVFDYKTRTAMTPAAIRGETKSTTGNYFRQLVFYTLLLSRDPRYHGKEIRASLVFLVPDKNGVCQTRTLPVTTEDLVRLHAEIQSLIEFVWSGKLGDYLPHMKTPGR
jgi:DNA helicase-2/ATP-dependent DNA helicase PcrA